METEDQTSPQKRKVIEKSTLNLRNPTDKPKTGRDMGSGTKYPAVTETKSCIMRGGKKSPWTSCNPSTQAVTSAGGSHCTKAPVLSTGSSSALFKYKLQNWNLLLHYSSAPHFSYTVKRIKRSSEVITAAPLKWLGKPGQVS